VTVPHAYIVTVKLPRNPAHNPRAKVSGECPEGGAVCTDTTGEHHSVVVLATSLENAVALLHETRPHLHITRVETAVMIGIDREFES
jgi:hypothetical protein